jgi:tetraacyldisaccharide 4'-kinase
VAGGAEALVLDDCLQYRAVRPEVLLAVVAAETWESIRLPLPAGPWREGLSALRRADGVVVTMKTAGEGEAEQLARRLAACTRGEVAIVARLAIAGFAPLGGGARAPTGVVAGREVVAVCGIGEPRVFAAQLAALGSPVRLLDHGDHHAYRPADVARAVAAARSAGSEAEPAVVVTTAKDAVKLRPLWPATGPPCLVAQLDVTLTAGAGALASLLDRVATAARAYHPGAAAAPPASER